MPDNSILIVGTGALATFFAHRLGVSGARVAMLGTWPEGLEALSQSGAQIEGQGSVSVKAVRDVAECRGTKLALVLTKAWQTERVAGQLAACLAEDGLAVSLQNGLGSDDILAKFLGRSRVVRGVTTFGVTLLAPGMVRLCGEGGVILESRTGLEAFATMLRVANMSVEIPSNIETVIWEKLIANAAINPLTALLQLKNGELLENPHARELMDELAREATEVAKKSGVRIRFQRPERFVAEIVCNTAQNTSSMLQEMLRGGPTEINFINGAVVRTGENVEVSTPFNRVICSMVKAKLDHGKM